MRPRSPPRPGIWRRVRFRSDSVCYWAACKTAPQYEAVVARRLVDMLGCVIYLPRAKVVLPRSLRPVTAPLFRTYIFADIDQGPPWQAIRRQPGVISIVMTGDAPSRCPESEILKLKAAEVNGLVQLAGQPPPSAQRFTVGEKVKIRYGALDGHEARYAGEADKQRKACVLVCLLGRQVMVKIAADALAAYA
jgi:transcription antitermination factor NusG